MSDIQNKIDRITDILRRDDGISGAMHYTEQISWILFLKFLDDFESNKADEAILDGKEYEYVMRKDLRWENWACPKDENGKVDVKRALTGSDLIEFVNKTLFGYLQEFKNNTSDPKSIKYKIGAIFEFLDNRIASGHTLREVLDIIDSLNFQSSDELFELSHIYENLLKGMGSDGGNSGEFYTPRAVIKAMVETVNPQVGETIYDGAVGSAGFLVEAFEFMTLPKKKEKLSASDWKTIQTDTFFGQEKTSLGYVMGMMNMILHGIESPNVYKGNTLTQNIRDFQEKDRHNVILANPPFGGKEKTQIQQNFPIETNATEMLFLQHFMKMLKLEGRAAIIVPEGFLFQANNAFKKIKQDLLEGFNVHTIVSLPSGVFLPYSGVKTNILYFDRKGATSKIWYYEVNPPYKLTKNKPIAYEHMQEFVNLFNHPNKRNPTNRKTVEGCNDWTVSVEDIVDYDISAKNPHKANDIQHIAPEKLIAYITQNDLKINELALELKNGIIDNEFLSVYNSDYVVSFNEIVESKDLGIVRNANEQSEVNQYKYLKMNNISIDGSLTFDKTTRINATSEEVEKFKLMKGDFLFNTRNSYELVGKTAVFNFDETMLFNNNIMRIKFKKHVNPDFINYQFQSSFIQSELNKIKSGTTSVVAIYYKSLANLKLVCPPKPEQDRLVERFNHLVLKSNLLNDLLNKKIDSIKFLKASLLDQAFKEEL
ncbi:N-6 DNA methylase [Empedobacter brevis]|uniref:N-6 DNA methylase n=1 Tax=Empedobacter brevis TaxID=247 RepID=UPI0016249E5F|nr:N-6 DNA methylase [Empedobacter brevis]